MDSGYQPLWSRPSRRGIGSPRSTYDVYFDHTSILKLVEMRWQLPMMTHRDEAAVAPLAALDLTSPEPPFLELDLPKLKHPWPSNRHVRKGRARQQRREARQRLRGRR